MLVGADGANSAIAKKLAGPLQASDMEVAFGYRAPLPKKADAPTVIAFLPGWVGYAWAFPRLDHISFGIATTQDAFEHKALDELLWQFMFGYYRNAMADRSDEHLEELSGTWRRCHREKLASDCRALRRAHSRSGR